MKMLTTITLAALLVIGACPLEAAEGSTAELPGAVIWERKSAPAVILGRYVDWKLGDNPFPPGFWGNRESLKGGSLPPVDKDSVAGTFKIEWDICYPLMHSFNMGWKILLFPGDTVRLDIDREAFNAYTTYRQKSPRDSVTTQRLQELWKKAVRIEGGTFELPLPMQLKRMTLGYTRQYSAAHLHDTFDEWREVCWREFQDVVQQLDTLDLSPAELAYLRMTMEQDYITTLRQFMFAKTCYGLIQDKDSIAMYEQQFTFKDPHAPELTYYRTITGFYACLNNLFGEGREYIKANGLEASPLGRWFMELDEAKAVMTRVKARQPVSDSELDALSPEFQVQIREVKAQLQQEDDDSKGKICDLPEGEPQEWLPKIVAGHKGHFVFVDFWATWCGPCRTGMKEMEPMKDSLTARDVDFIYITDTSSSTDDWQKYVSQHSGDHYIVPNSKMKEMQIPEYDNAIPHYLIYNREGKLVKAISGWPGFEEMKAKLTEVLNN